MTKFIVLEGPDGVGKSTVLEKLKEHLTKNNYTYLLLREPGSTDVAEEVRTLTATNTMSKKTRLLLMLAARNDLFETVIQPQIEQKTIDFIIVDRFALSSLVYNKSETFSVETINELNQFVLGSFVPDLTVVLTADFEAIKQRRHSRGRDKDVYFDEAFARHTLFRYSAYNKEMTPYAGDVFIDTTSLEPDTVVQKIFKEMEKLNHG